MQFVSHQHIDMEINQNSERRAIHLKWTPLGLYSNQPLKVLANDTTSPAATTPIYEMKGRSFGRWNGRAAVDQEDLRVHRYHPTASQPSPVIALLGYGHQEVSDLGRWIAEASILLSLSS